MFHSLIALLLAASPLQSQSSAAAQRTLAAPPVPHCTGVPGSFAPQWIFGSDCTSDPQIQVHAYNSDFFILRQSLCTSYEAPFMYLIFGSEKVLLLDTGNGGIDLYGTVSGIIANWLAQHSQASIELVVAHTHAHGDHHQGDSQFVGKPSTRVVGLSPLAVQTFFGITNWPTQTVTFDLGGRALEIVPIPGHEASHIAVWDPRTQILITGDSLYPGRLYVFGATGQGNWAVYKASMLRLQTFLQDREVCHVLGTHIEMTQTPGVDFPFASTFHPNEHVLELGREHLHELNHALSLLPTPQKEVHPDFIIYPIG